MKIEKLNDRQIRCTLTREDLEMRQIQLSELAYGSSKTQSLFHDMMQQAADDFGFEAGDAPLMIEAIPLPSDTIMLIISKVDSPDELDTRFSNFTQKGDDSFEKLLEDNEAIESEEASDLMKMIERMRDDKTGTNEDETKSEEKQNNESEEKPAERVRIYNFDNLDTAIRLAHVLDGFYQGPNSIYKNAKKQTYHLLLRQGSHTNDDFNRVSNIVSEYLHSAKYSAGSEAYFNEHLTLILADQALQTLAKI